MLPGNILDIFFVLPAAIREEKADGTLGDDPFHIKVGRRVNAIFNEWILKAEASNDGRDRDSASSFIELKRKSMFNWHNIPEFASNAEDLNGGLLFIQRLSGHEVGELLAEACDKIPQRGQANKKPFSWTI
eukprot:UN1555